MSKGHHIAYSPKELAWIEQRRGLPRREAHALFCRTFGRSDVSVVNFTALCMRKGWTTGRTGCFPKGNVPFNRGQRMPYNANCARTQFKKGQLPHNTKYLGHERVNVDGYVEISIKETNPHTGYERRYVHKHKYLWEQLHGPVPAGHCLKCLDGNKRNTDPSNWECISRAVLQQLNHRARTVDYDDAPPAVKPVILTLAKLKRARWAKTKVARGPSA